MSFERTNNFFRR